MYIVIICVHRTSCRGGLMVYSADAFESLYPQPERRRRAGKHYIEGARGIHREMWSADGERTAPA